MARAGMANLIQEVRKLANIGTADYTAGTVVYWTDDQIQEALDDHRNPAVKFRALNPDPDFISGAYSYTEYPIPDELQWFEESGSGSGWAVRDSTGADAPTYTVNYRTGLITFASSTAGTIYYLSCRTYDLYRAVADIWEAKAQAAASSGFRWKSDNMEVDRTSIQAQFMSEAARFRRLAGVRVFTMDRDDSL